MPNLRILFIALNPMLKMVPVDCEIFRWSAGWPAATTECRSINLRAMIFLPMTSSECWRLVKILLGKFDLRSIKSLIEKKTACYLIISADSPKFGKWWMVTSSRSSNLCRSTTDGPMHLRNSVNWFWSFLTKTFCTPMITIPQSALMRISNYVAGSSSCVTAKCSAIDRLIYYALLSLSLTIRAFMVSHLKRYAY